MSVVVVGINVIVSIKIARSQDLGICVCCNHNESVDIGEKLASVRFELLNMAHKRYKLCIFCSAVVYRPHPLCSMCFLLMHITTTQVSR